MSTPHNAVMPAVKSGGGFTIWIIIIAFCLAGLAGTYMLFVEAPPPRKITIATGGKAGAYYKYATQYAEILKDQGLELDVKATKGSVENLELLKDKNSGVAVAIVQSGVAKPEDRDKFLALGSLYREPLFVFYREEKPLFEDKPPPKKIVIATGGSKGAYYGFGKEYAAELQKEGITLEVRATAGSVENLKLLNDDKSGVTVAFVQSGVAKPSDAERLAALGSLYREPLWVFTNDGAVDNLAQLEAGEIFVGSPASGTYPVAMELLRANGVVDANFKPLGNTKLVEQAADLKTFKTAEEGKSKAAFFVASIEAPIIQELLNAAGVHLLSFAQHEAYHRKFRFLSEVTLPAGLIDLKNNIPQEDVHLLAPTAMLVVRKDIHPTLASLLLSVAAKVHAKGDKLSNPGEFPSAAYADIPISEAAKQFYRAGLPGQRVPPIDRLSYFEGKRIGIGVKGSGAYAIATELLKANNLADKEGKTAFIEDPADVAARKLRRVDKEGKTTSSKEDELDVGFFVAAVETGYIQDLMRDPFVRLLDFSQHEAYHRRFRYLSEVTIPAGLVNLGYNVPPQDIHLVAPTAMLVVRKDLHPALATLLLETAARVHGKGDQFTSPGEFPTDKFTDIPVSEDAKNFYKHGPSFLQRVLPFWLASLVDRLKIMLIPLVMLLMPLVRAAPPLVQWRTRRKIYRWYSALRDIDKKIATGLAGPQLDVEIARLRDIEHQVAFVEVPLSYMSEFYHLRLHLTMVQQKLEQLRKGSTS